MKLYGTHFDYRSGQHQNTSVPRKKLCKRKCPVWQKNALRVEEYSAYCLLCLLFTSYSSINTASFYPQDIFSASYTTVIFLCCHSVRSGEILAGKDEGGVWVSQRGCTGIKKGGIWVSKRGMYGYQKGVYGDPRSFLKIEYFIKILKVFDPFLSPAPQKSCPHCWFNYPLFGA